MRMRIVPPLRIVPPPLQSLQTFTPSIPTVQIAVQLQDASRGKEYHEQLSRNGQRVLERMSGVASQNQPSMLSPLTWIQPLRAPSSKTMTWSKSPTRTSQVSVTDC